MNHEDINKQISKICFKEPYKSLDKKTKNALCSALEEYLGLEEQLNLDGIETGFYQLDKGEEY